MLLKVRITCCREANLQSPNRKLAIVCDQNQRGAMRFHAKFLAIIVAALFCVSNSAPVKKPPTRLKKPPTTIQKFDPFVGVKDSGKILVEAFSNNAIANVFKNTYSFFYWLPRRNIPFDTPWKLFGESMNNIQDSS